MDSFNHHVTSDLLKPLNPFPPSYRTLPSFPRPRLDRSCRPDPKIFGHIAGVSPGQSWATRAEVSQAGVHAPFQGGISGTAQRGGAESIVLNGGYPDGDCGDIIWYMGSGGFKHPITGQRSSKMFQDQLPSTHGNRAMQQSLHSEFPIRVVRGADDSKSPWAPYSGYRYDGLYKVTHAASIDDPSGLTSHTCLVWRLERVPSSSYSIPVRIGYQPRALEKASLGQQRKLIEDHIAVQDSPLPKNSTSHPCRESTSHQPRSTEKHFAQSKTSINPLSNRYVKPLTACQPTWSPASPSTDDFAQRTGPLGMKEALKQIKFLSKPSTFGMPDSPNILSSQMVCTSIDSINTATASPSTPSLSPSSNWSEELSSPSSFERPHALRETDSPPALSPRNFTSIAPPTFANIQLPASLIPPIRHCKQSPCSSPLGLVHHTKSSTTAPLSSTPFKMIRSHSPVPTRFTEKSDLDMEAHSILSPLPVHDFTGEKCEKEFPISECQLDRASNLDNDVKFDQHLNIINKHPGCDANKQMEWELEPSAKLETEEDELCSISNTLPISFPVDTHGMVVKTDMSVACEVQKQATIDSSLDQDSVNSFPREHKMIHHDTLCPLDDDQKFNVEAFNQYYINDPHGYVNLKLLDNYVPKDKLNGTLIHYNEEEQKYLVGGFELMEEDEDDEDDDTADYIEDRRGDSLVHDLDVDELDGDHIDNNDLDVDELDGDHIDEIDGQPI